MNSNFPVVLSQVTQVLRSEDMQRQVKTLLPPSIKPDKFTEVTLAAIANNPDVLEADRDSLYRACVQAARRGLLPDKREGALVIYNTNIGTREQPRWMKMVQFMPMVEGIIKEMAKAEINAYAVSVYEEDAIALWNDDEGQHVKHEPVVFGERGMMVGVFAAAKAKDGRTYIEAMSTRDIEQVARRSKQNTVDKHGVIQYGGTWRSDFDRMAQKSALHRLRKRLPILDEDALQNLKDMEEESDTDLPATTPVKGEATSPGAQTEPNPPPPTQAALEAPKEGENQQLLKPRAPRRSRVLQGVVEAAKATQAGAPEQVRKADTPAPAPAKAAVTPQPPPQEESPEYTEDDIV